MQLSLTQCPDLGSRSKNILQKEEAGGRSTNYELK